VKSGRLLRGIELLMVMRVGTPRRQTKYGRIGEGYKGDFCTLFAVAVVEVFVSTGRVVHAAGPTGRQT